MFKIISNTEKVIALGIGLLFLATLATLKYLDSSHYQIKSKSGVVAREQKEEQADPKYFLVNGIDKKYELKRGNFDSNVYDRLEKISKQGTCVIIELTGQSEMITDLEEVLCKE